MYRVGRAPTRGDAVTNLAVAEQPRHPRLYQERAIHEVVKRFRTSERGQLIMASGTGKTLTTMWTAEAMCAERVLLLFPSIHLLRQTLLEWRSDHTGFDPGQTIAVCSEADVGKPKAGEDQDEIVGGLADLEDIVDVTTNSLDLRRFLLGDGPRLVLSTYQSSAVVAAAQRSRTILDFDLSIADEAHRVAGDRTSDFATIIHEGRIRSRRRLFTTATPLIFSPRAKGREPLIVSMDDKEAFGPVFFRYSFSDAISDGVLSDYVAVVAAMSEEEAFELVGRTPRPGELITPVMKDTAHEVALLRAMSEHDLRSVVTFHRTIAGAEALTRRVPELFAAMPASRRPKGTVTASHVNGEMPVTEREKVLSRLAGSARGERVVVTNAKCLTEGVDVPAIDCVAFMNPRSSEIDIVQAVGRALRKHGSDRPAVVLMALVVADPGEHADPKELLKAEGWQGVVKVVDALRAHDERLGQALDKIRISWGKGAGTGSGDGASGGSDGGDQWIPDEEAGGRNGQAVSPVGVRERDEADTTPPDVADDPEHFLSSHVQLLAPADLDRAALTRRLAVALRVVAVVGSTEDWSETYGKLLAWVDGHEGRYPSRGAASGSEERFLEQWIRSQRRARKDGRLSAERADLLEAVPGWSWDALESAWQESYGKLLKWLDEHEGRYPSHGAAKGSEERSPGRWVRSQRRARKIGTMTDERAALLEMIPGWTWDAFGSAWQEAYERLLAWLEEHGSRYPSHGAAKGSEELFLEQWVRTQRQAKKNGTLPDERAALLETIPGWTWDPFASAWQEAYQQLLAWLDGHEGRYPSKEAAKGSKERSLAMWVDTQRQAKKNGRLSDERSTLLKAIPGWRW